MGSPVSAVIPDNVLIRQLVLHEGRGSKEGYTPRRVDAARADDDTLICGGGTGMDQIVGAAARLPDNERKDLAILALARSATITDLAIGRGVSRKFVYAQTQKARVALDDAFLPAGADDVLFELAVTKT